MPKMLLGAMVKPTNAAAPVFRKLLREILFIIINFKVINIV